MVNILDPEQSPPGLKFCVLVESIYKNSIFIFSNIFMWKGGCHLTSLKVIRDVGKCPYIRKGAESDGAGRRANIYHHCIWQTFDIVVSHCIWHINAHRVMNPDSNKSRDLSIRWHYVSEIAAGSMIPKVVTSFYFKTIQLLSMIFKLSYTIPYREVLLRPLVNTRLGW